MIVRVGFTRAELESFVGTTVPDLVGPGLRLLFVGINPGLWTAATQTHFAHPGNRFYPALLLGGVIDRPIDRGTGFTADDREYLVTRGIGITNLAKRATAKASELSAEELRRGGAELRAFVRERQPVVVAVAGVTAYRTAFGNAKVALGEQPDGFEGARLWIVPNPSGLNAHETVATLAEAYRQPALRRRHHRLTALPSRSKVCHVPVLAPFVNLPVRIREPSRRYHVQAPCSWPSFILPAALSWPSG